MKRKTDARHSARKLALSSIFCWLFSEPNHEECINLAKDLLESASHEIDLELTKQLVEGVTKNRREIDKIIEKSAPEWPLEKISKIDVAILRIAIFEMVFGKTAPDKVVIDEAVELAKEFGNDTSGKFVNGVLGNVIESTEEK